MGFIGLSLLTLFGINTFDRICFEVFSELAEEKCYPPRVICQFGPTESMRLYIYIVVVMYTTLNSYQANNLMGKRMMD